MPVLRTGPSVGKHFLLMVCCRADDSSRGRSSEVALLPHTVLVAAPVASHHSPSHSNGPICRAQNRPVSMQTLLNSTSWSCPRFKPRPVLGSRIAATHGSVGSAGSESPQPKPFNSNGLICPCSEQARLSASTSYLWFVAVPMNQAETGASKSRCCHRRIC